jgi:hypothetical protein
MSQLLVRGAGSGMVSANSQRTFFSIFAGITGTR